MIDDWLFETTRARAREAEAALLEQARVCPNCPGATQRSIGQFTCPCCGDAYPLQSLQRVRAAEVERDALRAVLRQCVEALEGTNRVRQAMRQETFFEHIIEAARAALGEGGVE